MRPSLQGWYRKARAGVAGVLLLAMSLVPGLPVQAAATPAQALETLQHYGLVLGDPSGNLMLGETITRAQMATILVRAIGLEAEATLLATARPFPDVAGPGHWAAGHVMVAKNLGLIQGYPDGTFGPSRPLNYAEAMTLFLRLIQEEPKGGQWPDNVIQRATALKLVPANLNLSRVAKNPAPRQDVFVSFEAALSTPNPEGQTLLQKIDTEPPTVILDNLPNQTQSDKVTVSGTVSSDTASVTINGQAAPLRAGTFSLAVSLKNGANKIVVVATDYAGNQTTETVQVQRGPVISRIEIVGPTEVITGASATYSVEGYDTANNKQAITGAQLTMAGTAATFDPKAFTIKAGAATGSVTLTATYLNLRKTLDVKVVGPASAATELEIPAVTLKEGVAGTIKVNVLDKDGKVLTTDNGREITLTASDKDVTISPTTVKTAKGVASFQVKAEYYGLITVTATAAGVKKAEKDITVAATTSVELTADRTRVQPGDDVRIRATLVNADGRAITNNTRDDIEIRLSTSGADGFLSREYIYIPAGRSSSTGEDAYAVADSTGTLRVSGRIVSKHNYPVLPVTVSVASSVPSGGSATSAYELRARPWRIAIPPAPGDQATFEIQVLDQKGFTVEAGSYAFQLAVDTGEPKTNGIPSDVTIKFAGEEVHNLNTFVFRTYKGSADIQVIYGSGGGSPGTVTLKPVAHRGGNGIPSDLNGSGFGSSSSGLRMTSGALFYGPTSHGGLRALLTSSKSKEPSTWGGILPAGSNDFVTVVVEATDSTDVDNAVFLPGISGVKLQLRPVGELRATEWWGSAERTMKDGKAQFEIRAKAGAAGLDWYQITDDKGKASQVFAIAVQDARTDGSPTSTSISNVEGINAIGIPSKDEIFPEDNWVDITINTTSTSPLVYATVTHDGGSTWTSPVFNLAAPIIRVPRSKITTNRDTTGFSVRLHTAVASGDTSPKYTPVRVVREFKPSISKVVWSWADDGTAKLIITGSGFATSGRSVEVDVTKLIVLDRDRIPYNLINNQSNATVDSSSKITVNVGGGDATQLGNTARYSGDIKLSPQEGWLHYGADEIDPAKPRGVSSAMGEIKISPAGHISQAAVNLATGVITFQGEGIPPNAAAINKTAFTIGGDKIAEDATWVVRTNEIIAQVKAEQREELETALGDAVRHKAAAAAGWLFEQSGANAAVDNITVTYAAEIRGATLYRSKAELVLIGPGGLWGTTNTSDGATIDLAKFELSSGNATKTLTGATGTLDSNFQLTIDMTQHPDWSTIKTWNNAQLKLKSEWWKDGVTGLSALPYELTVIPR